MEGQMRTQGRHGQGSAVIGAFVVASALVIGGVGGYALRGVSAEIRSGQAASAETAQTILVPRAVREGLEITPFQAPAPRWTHEDDATYATGTLLVPRSVREGTEVTPFQAPAPRWTHEDDDTK